MKKLRLPLIYGGLSGLIMSLSWLSMHLFFMKDGKLNMDGAEIVGYTTMILSLSAVFIGIKYERDRNKNGVISFKDAFLTGLGIVLVASLFYTISWAIYYPNFAPNFAEEYAACQIQKYQESGMAPEALEAKKIEMQEWIITYKNPFVMLGWTFIEIFPLGVVMTLIFSLILKRKSKG